MDFDSLSLSFDVYIDKEKNRNSGVFFNLSCDDEEDDENWVYVECNGTAQLSVIDSDTRELLYCEEYDFREEDFYNYRPYDCDEREVFLPFIKEKYHGGKNGIEAEVILELSIMDYDYEPNCEDFIKKITEMRSCHNFALEPQIEPAPQLTPQFKFSELPMVVTDDNGDTKIKILAASIIYFKTNLGEYIFDCKVEADIEIVEKRRNANKDKTQSFYFKIYDSKRKVVGSGSVIGGPLGLGDVTTATSFRVFGLDMREQYTLIFGNEYY